VYLLTNTALSAAVSRAHGVDTAVLAFKGVRTQDRYATRGMDSYAALLHASADARELAGLAQELVSLNKAPASASGAGTGAGAEGSAGVATLPQCGECWVAAAMHSELQGEPERALDFINKAIQAKPNNAVALKLKGNMLLARERPEEAVVLFLQSNTIIKDMQCYEGICKVLVSLGRLSDAILSAKEAIVHMQKCPEAFSLMGSILAGSTDGKSHAIKCYSRALKLDPSNELALDSLAALLGRMDKADEAIKCLEDVIKRKPSAQLLIRLAKLLSAYAGAPHAAIQYLNDAIHLSADGSSYHTEIGEELEVAERLMRGEEEGFEGDDQMNISDDDGR
jgi:tetratricopeptide (TPR) repeat protein